jgi:glycerate kinase
VKKNTIIITGEGFLDSQSLYGKAPISLSNYLKEKDVFLVAIGGRIDYNILEKLLEYFHLVLPAGESKDDSFCIKNSKMLLKNISASIAKILILRSSIFK